MPVSRLAIVIAKSSDRDGIKLLITDLDNTLWDWFRAWHASFSAMLHRLVMDSGIPQRQLEREIREVHQRRRTSEYSYLLNELPSLAEKHTDPPPATIYDGALHAQNRERKRNTELYPGVRSTLKHLKGLGVPIVAYSESIAYWTEWRIRQTGLDGLIDVLYTSPDHDLPEGVSFTDIRTRPTPEYGLHHTQHRHTPVHVVKPDPTVLEKILTDYRVEPHESVYVGDSLMKDVAMAQKVGAVDVHASYGVVRDRSSYALLQRVSHWNQEDVEREQKLHEEPDIVPSFAIERFDQLSKLFDFTGSVA